MARSKLPTILPKSCAWGTALAHSVSTAASSTLEACWREFGDPWKVTNLYKDAWKKKFATWPVKGLTIWIAHCWTNTSKTVLLQDVFPWGSGQHATVMTTKKLLESLQEGMLPCKKKTQYPSPLLRVRLLDLWKPSTKSSVKRSQWLQTADLPPNSGWLAACATSATLSFLSLPKWKPLKPF